MTTEFESDAYVERRGGDPCRICGGPVTEYREKRRLSMRGTSRWSRWCVTCDRAAKACKCPPQRIGA